MNVPAAWSSRSPEKGGLPATSSSKIDGPAWIAWTFFFGRDHGVKGGFAAA
jgi:hypothetical protein